MDIGSLILIVFVLTFIYFIPSIIAKQREHYDTWAIFITNLFLGWTFLGWVISLIWATKKTLVRKIT